MTNEQFNALIDELIGGLPITMVVNRLTLALRYVLEGIPVAEARFRDFVRQYRERER
jgi:hypothetical protein